MKTAKELADKYNNDADYAVEDCIADAQRYAIESAKARFFLGCAYTGQQARDVLDLLPAAKPPGSPHVHVAHHIPAWDSVDGRDLASKVVCKCGATRKRGWIGDWVEPTAC
jgi:hypothetical protein